MKNFKTALALLTAALVALALFATPTSGISLANVGPPVDNYGANLELRPAGGSYDTGTVIEVVGNFTSATSGQQVTLYKEDGAGTDNYEVEEVDTSANSSGNAYFHPTVDDGARRYFAQDASGRQTELQTVTGNTPVPQEGTLNPPTNSGKTWTSKFTPGVNGKSVELQIQRIYTHEVSDVDAVDPSVSKTKRVGPWKTIATGTQNADGETTFNLASPYPYRVPHRYRVISGSAKSCEHTDNSVATTSCQVFGLPLTPAKNSGLSAVYFNTNEGHAIDTRSRYYEGEFRMSADSKGLGCTDLGVADPTKQVKLSVMKGRGNYSWSFKRKSYTLKLGSDKDLCGMGSNNKWALVSQDYDKALSRNALAQYVGSKFTNMAWTPESTPVDLYLNGKYLGNYMLVERISIDSDRVAIDELKGGEKCEGVDTPDDQVGVPSHPNNNQPCITGGYILEWDFRRGGDRNVTVDGRGYVGVKDPEFDRDRENAITKQGITSQQLTYIDDYLNDADNALANAASSNTWKNYIDMDSAVDYYLAMEYMKPVDGNMWASVYMYKPRGGKLFFGPMWDFDLAAGSANRAGNVVSSSGWYLRDNLQVSAMHPENKTPKYNTWFNQLNKNQSFRTAKAARWNEISSQMNVSGFLDTHKSNIKTSAEQTYQSSPSSHGYRISPYQIIKSNFDADMAYLRSWATSRKSWMNGQF